LQAPEGDIGLANRLIWRRHWTEDWSVLIGRMARALEARLEA
jgi:hypothetical protein